MRIPLNLHLSRLLYCGVLFGIADAITAPQYVAANDSLRTIKSRALPSLRILCLGASITWGQGSTTGNGYRDDLRTLLQADGTAVHFVGTQSSGNMPNNANEGYPGMRIDQISGLGWAAYGYLPNVILIHAGTNDCVQNTPPDTSASRMGTLLDQIYSALPANTLVVVSKLVPNRKVTTETNIEGLNSQLDGIVNSRTSQGKNIVIVDMHAAVSIDDIGPDGTHPIDGGYQKMAAAWHGAITSAQVPATKANGLSDTDNTNNVKCAFNADSITSPHTEQLSFGTNASIFRGAWNDVGVIFTDPATANQGSGVFWGNVDGQGADDYIHIDSSGAMSVAINTGSEKFGAINSFGTPPSCGLSSIRFADITGDGKAEYICTGTDGSWTAYSLPGFSKIAGVGAAGSAGAGVWLADLNSDGLADQIALSSSGAVSISFNQGGLSFGGFTTVLNLADFNATNVHFMDINGDGRADYVFLQQDGSIVASLNFADSDLHSVDFVANGIILHPIPTLGPDQMTFGRIRGSQKWDMVTLHKDGSIKLWENKGYDGFAYGAYARYCDMTGSGSDSYVTMGTSGSMKLYQNLHDGAIHLKFGPILGDQGVARADVHLADIDGDGKCDYVIVNNKTGTLTAALNQGLKWVAKTGSPMTLGPRNPLSGVSGCDSAGIRFADINGDGKADYICISQRGDVSIALNNGNDFAGASTKFNVADDIANLGGREAMSFKDIDGDGYADYLLFSPSDGSVSTRLNQNAGNSFGSLSKIYSDISFVDGFVHFANMNGLGRADMINVKEISGKGKMSSNKCPPLVPPSNGLGPNPNPPNDSGDDDDSGDDYITGRDNYGDEPDENDPDEDTVDIDNYEPCDFSVTYSSLDALKAAAPALRSDCLAVSTMQVLADTLDAAYANYTDVSNGYDAMFPYYVTYMKNLVPQIAAQQFMFNYSATPNYETMPFLGYGMEYFKCSGGPNAADNFPCTDYWKHQLDDKDYPTTLTLENHDGYIAGLAEAGLDPLWVTFGDYTLDLSSGHQSNRYVFHGFPVANSSMVIPNPQDIVTKGIGSIPNLQKDLTATLLDMMLGQWWNGSVSDGPEAYSTPVFMLMQAVENMAQAEILGAEEEQEEEEEANREKNFIITLIGAILMFVPILGEELSIAAGLDSLAQAISIAGDLGNAALGVYSIVLDPKSAIVDILGLIIGVGAFVKAARDGEGIASIAKLKKGMSDTESAAIGKVFHDKDLKLSAIGKVCRIK